MTIFQFPATQILRVEVLPEGRFGVPFLNWRVAEKAIGLREAPRDAFAGAGIYGVCFDSRLIYIGSFLGTGGDWLEGLKASKFAGDIAKGRWWQHFGSITGRSRCLSVTPRTKAALTAEFGPDHPMVAAFGAAMPNLAIDAGCLGALERLRFAASRFAEFCGEHVEPSQVLSRFCYVYVRFDELPETMSAHQLSRWIKDTETLLIETLHPEVNTAGRIAGPAPVRIDCSQIGAKIQDALNECRGVAQPMQSEAPAVVPQPADAPALDEAADEDQTNEFYAELSAEKQAQFTSLVELIQQRNPAAGRKVVGRGYTGQPKGYDKKPTLTFGRITPGGLAKDPIGRIPLVDEEKWPLTVTLPSSARAPDLDEDLIAEGSSGMWRPLNLTHFLQNANLYLR